jgi:hypothetical protein
MRITLLSGLRNKLLLRAVIFLSLLLSLGIYFLYRPASWPLGTEPASCLLSVSSFIILLVYLRSTKENNSENIPDGNIRIGLYIGLLWTIEISINNFIRPGLPQRDIIDNAFWAVIALMILIRTFLESYKSGRFDSGFKTGFWLGLSSGAVACLSALTLIVFGMKFILLDPLNIKEWVDTRGSIETPGMYIYFAYQTFAGAIMHLYVLGIIMGLLLGTLGGLTGKFLKLILK